MFFVNMFKKTEKVEEVVVSEENKEGSDENNVVDEHGGLANDEKEPDDETKEKYLSELVERKKTEDELELKMSEIKVENNGEEPEELKESVFKKCQAMPFPYLESTEIEMRLREENSKLFGEGEDKSLILAKLYEKFKQDVEKYKPEQFEDNFRSKDAHAYGGMNFNNPVITSLIRSAGYEVIKQIGKKIFCR